MVLFTDLDADGILRLDDLSISRLINYFPQPQHRAVDLCNSRVVISRVAEILYSLKPMN
jgi:hypothetical protein